MDFTLISIYITHEPERAVHQVASIRADSTDGSTFNFGEWPSFADAAATAATQIVCFVFDSARQPGRSHKNRYTSPPYLPDPPPICTTNVRRAAAPE